MHAVAYDMAAWESPILSPSLPDSTGSSWSCSVAFGRSLLRQSPGISFLCACVVLVTTAIYQKGCSELQRSARFDFVFRNLVLPALKIEPATTLLGHHPCLRYVCTICKHTCNIQGQTTDTLYPKDMVMRATERTEEGHSARISVDCT